MVVGGGGEEGRRIRTKGGGRAWGKEYSDWLREAASGGLL